MAIHSRIRGLRLCPHDFHDFRRAPVPDHGKRRLRREGASHDPLPRNGRRTPASELAGLPGAPAGECNCLPGRIAARSPCSLQERVVPPPKFHRQRRQAPTDPRICAAFRRAIAPGTCNSSSVLPESTMRVWRQKRILLEEGPKSAALSPSARCRTEARRSQFCYTRKAPTLGWLN